jgi:hypothetical protein
MTAESEFLIRLRPLPDARPAEVRLRQVLKHALRAERFACVRAESIPVPKRPIPHAVYSRRPGAGWRCVKKVADEQAAHRWILDNREKFSNDVELTAAPVDMPPSMGTKQ